MIARRRYRLKGGFLFFFFMRPRKDLTYTERRKAGREGEAEDQPKHGREVGLKDNKSMSEMRI